MFFPFLGAAAEAIAVSAHKRWFGYRAFVASMLAFAALSMSVWAHHMFTTGGVTNEYFAFTSTALVVPAGIEYFDLIATLIGGAIVLRTSMLFALDFFLQFLIGGLTGIFVASPVLDYHAHDSYFIVAHFHYTLFAGSVFGFFAGVYHWFPKITGALLRERLGKLQLVAAGGRDEPDVLPDVLPRRRRDAAADLRYPAHPGWGTLNLLESIGAGIIALGDADVPGQRRRLAAPAASRPATTRGAGTRSSGRPPRRRRRTTSTGRCRRSAPTRRCSTCAEAPTRAASAARRRAA